MMKKNQVIILVTIQVLLQFCLLIHSEPLSLAEEENSSVQSRARHDVLIGEGTVESAKEQNVAENRGETASERENESPLSLSYSSHSSFSTLPEKSSSSAIEGFTPFQPNNSSEFKRSFDSFQSFAPSFKSSTSNTQKAIRDALTSGSPSLADFSSFLASQSSFSSSTNAQTSDSRPSFSPNDQPIQEEDFEQQKTDLGDGVEDVQKVTCGNSESSGNGVTQEQVTLDETPSVHSSSSSSSAQGPGGGKEPEYFPTQQMVPYQSPRPPNVRAPQVSMGPLNRHWANKHAWFATRRPNILRPFFPPRPRTSPRPFSFFPPHSLLPPPSTPTHGKGFPSMPRTQKYMRPVDYVRNRFYPKRRNMFPPSYPQFQRRPSLFSSLFHPVPSPSSSHMTTLPNQMQSPNSPVPMMYPMNLRNWLLRNPLFSGTRRPIQSMNPSLLAFPFPVITNRLPPSKFDTMSNQDPRRRNNKKGHNRGGIKTASSTTSSTFTTQEVDRKWTPHTSYKRRSSTKLNGNKRGKSRSKNRLNINGKSYQRSLSGGDTRSETNDNFERKEEETLESRKIVSDNTWRGINSEKLTKKRSRRKKEKRENVSKRRIVRNVSRNQMYGSKAHRIHNRSYATDSRTGMERVFFNDESRKEKKTGPIIVPVSSYISFITSSSSSPTNTTSKPQHYNYPPRTIQMRAPDVTLAAEPTFQLFDGGHSLDKHDIHHHYYYNDRSDSEPDEEEEKYRKQKKDEEDQKVEKKEKKIKKGEIEEEKKKMKQKVKEKKFMDEKGKKKKVEEKKEQNEDDTKTKDKGEKDENYKSKEEGKLGVYWYKDSGHKKHGWKNVYHKEEYGDSKKFHDIFHDKDWKKKWNKWDKSKEKSKGSKYKSGKKRYVSKKTGDEKKVEKGGHKKWEHEHGSGYEKKEHLDKHQEHESHVKKSNDEKLKGKQSKNNRGVILKKPKVSKSHGKKYPAASNLSQYQYDHSSTDQDPHIDHLDQHTTAGKGTPITNSNDFRQSSLSGRKGGKKKKKHETTGSSEESERKRTKPLTDVTSRRVKHYPDEGPKVVKKQNVREHDPEEEGKKRVRGDKVEPVGNSEMEKNPKYFNRKKRPKDEDVVESNQEDEEDSKGNEDGEQEENEGEEEDENEKEVQSEGDAQHEKDQTGTNKKQHNKDNRLSYNGFNGKNPNSKEPVYYYPPNNVSASSWLPLRTGQHGRYPAGKINANLIAHKFQGGRTRSFSPFPQGPHQPFKQLLVVPPSPTSSASFMYPSMPSPVSTTIYGPTVPIIEQQPNSFQAKPSSSSFVPIVPTSTYNLIHRRPGLAFLSVLKSLTSAPTSVLFPSTSSSTSHHPTSATSSLLSSASTPQHSITKLLHHQPVAAASSPSPTHISSFSYHLQQLQEQKSRNKPSSR